MKKIILALIGIIALTSFTENTTLIDECEVKEFYKALETESDVKVLTTSGDLEEVELILVPTKMEEGTFKIEVTRKGSNIYKVEGTDYYIETRYCYEYATYDEAILKVESNYGYDKGTIIFNP
jgi:hypothetical protein